METITIDDFKKIDARVGKIVSAVAVPDSDKLIRFLVDVGEESPRQILSAIREYYPNVEELVGKSLLFCVNLAPRTIRGLESEGMLMAVGNERPIFLVPDSDTPAGSRIR